MSTTIIRIASPNIPALIVTSHCCSILRRDGNWIRIGFGQDPGQAGKNQALHLVRTALSGFTVSPALQSGDNLTQFGPLSSPCRAGNVKILRGAWNEELLRILEGLPRSGPRRRGQSSSGALEMFVAALFPQGSFGGRCLNQCHTLTGSKTRSGAIPDRQAREKRSRHLPNLTKPQIVTACPSRRSKQNHNGKSGPSGAKRPIGRSTRDRMARGKRVPRAWGWRAGRP